MSAYILKTCHMSLFFLVGMNPIREYSYTTVECVQYIEDVQYFQGIATTSACGFSP